MRIGIDIDDTITNTQDKIDEIAQNIENLELYDRSKHWFNERYNCSLEEDDHFFNTHVEDFMRNATLKDGASYYINRLHDEGYGIYLITARSNRYSSNVPNITLEYLKKYNIIYDQILFESRDKAKTCLDNDIDIMIDDAVHHIEEINNVGIKTIVMDNEYNKELDNLRAHSWEEVYEIITGGD